MSISAFIVEDNKSIQAALVPALKALANVDVVGMAEQEAAAIQWFKSHSNWELAIVDLILEQGSGMGVLAAIEDRMPNQKAVVLSNYCTPLTRERCLLLGADKVFDRATDLDDFFAYCQKFTARQPA